MSIVVFSKNGVHYEGGVSGSIMAIFVPSKENVRKYPDLSGNNISEIAERYGTGGKKPLWKLERSVAVVYGALLSELAERREEIKVYLPQQIVPASCNVFYMVFGQMWIVHGVRTVNDDGEAEWGVSKIKVSNGEVTTEVINAISERMLDGEDENYCIAVSNNEETFKDLKKGLQPFKLEAKRLEALKPKRGEESLYKHRNHSLVMLTIALLVVMMVATTAAIWFLRYNKLSQRRKEIKHLQMEISQIQLNERLDYIRDPKKVLDRMTKGLTRAPSSILNGAAQLGAEFGELGSVRFDVDQMIKTKNGKRIAPSVGISSQAEKNVWVEVAVSKMVNTKLVDQENMAKSLLKERPWIRDIKNQTSNAHSKNADLKVNMRIE